MAARLASGWLLCLPMALGPGCPYVALPCWVYGYLMIWLSLPSCLLLVLSGARQRRRSSFSVLAAPWIAWGHEPSPPGFKRSGSSAAQPAPTGRETKAKDSAGSHTDEAAALGRREQLVAQEASPVGRHRYEATQRYNGRQRWRGGARGKSVDQMGVSN